MYMYSSDYFSLLYLWLQFLGDVLLVFERQCHILGVTTSCHYFVILVDEADRRICQRLADYSQISIRSYCCLPLRHVITHICHIRPRL